MFNMQIRIMKIKSWFIRCGIQKNFCIWVAFATQISRDPLKYTRKMHVLEPIVVFVVWCEPHMSQTINTHCSFKRFHLFDFSLSLEIHLQRWECRIDRKWKNRCQYRPNHTMLKNCFESHTHTHTHIKTKSNSEIRIPIWLKHSFEHVHVCNGFRKNKSFVLSLSLSASALLCVHTSTIYPHFIISSLIKNNYF